MGNWLVYGWYMTYTTGTPAKKYKWPPMTMLVCAWYLQYTRHILPFTDRSVLFICHKKTFPPSSVDQFLQLIFYSIKTTNLHIWLWFSLHFQLIVKCLKLQREWWHNKRWVFVTFFGWKYAKYNKLTLLLTANDIPCLLPLMEVEGRETGVGRVKNDPAFLPGASEFRGLRTSRIGVKMGVFFQRDMVAGQSEGRGTLPW